MHGIVIHNYAQMHCVIKVQPEKLYAELQQHSTAMHTLIIITLL